MNRLQLPLMLALLVGGAVAWELWPSAEPEQVGYERATWRLAPERLAHVLLSVDHVLVRHSGSARDAGGYEGLPDQLGAAPKRSRQAALGIARDLQQRLSAEPDKFANVARAHSDDTFTAPWGGALGTVTASSLPPAMLDALAQMSVGSVSKVVETRQGFHVLRRGPRPNEEHVVAARQLSVAYRELDGMRVRPGHSKERSRKQAQELAGNLVAQLKRQPERLDDLIDQNSDHPSAAIGGDFGEWSSHAPEGKAREIAALTQLEVGGVSDPIDGPDGFRILVRTPLRPRTRYFWEEVFVAYDPGDSSARAQAEADTNSMAKVIATDPFAFGRFQAKYGSVAHGSFVEGRGSARIQQALSALPVGGVAKPLADDGMFRIVRRLDAETLAERAPSLPGPLFELPAPNVADVDFLVASADQGVVRSSLARVASDAGKALALSAGDRAQVDRVLQGLAATRAGDLSLSERTAAVKAAWLDLQSALGEQQYAAFRRFLEVWASNFLMTKW